MDGASPLGYAHAVSVHAMSHSSSPQGRREPQRPGILQKFRIGRSEIFLTKPERIYQDSRAVLSFMAVNIVISVQRFPHEK